MGTGVKVDEPTPMEGKKKLQLIIIVSFLIISTFVVPGTGFALKTCRISYNTAMCISRNLGAVPQDIPSRVKGFQLSQNKLSRIQKEDFENLPLLTELDLNQNHISQIENGSFTGLIFLKRLNLNNNRLVKLEENMFKGLTNLTELFIYKNRIRTVASMAFVSMTSLKALDISHNHIAEVQSILQHLPHLQKLLIRSNNLTTFHSWELTNRSLELKALDLSHNPIAVFRITADVFPNLNWLNIGDSPTKKQMMWDVHNKTFLSRVSTLDISGLQMGVNNMKTLLQSVNTSLMALRMNAMKRHLIALINISCTIPTMSSLQLHNNRLISVTSEMFKTCVNVTELDLGHNLIQNIQDDAFRPLQSLRTLSLSYNRLSSVPAATRNLPVLQELDLGSNKITEIGCYDFANHTQLRQLNLNGNSMSALKECVFKDLIRLRILKLQSNHLSKLNGAFRNYLPNLRQLFLNNNKLAAINQEEFKGLQSLQNLSLHDNQIIYLKKGCFIGLANLTELRLQKNLIRESEINKGVLNELINLRRLDFRENSIKYKYKSALLQPPFSQLSRLETLSIVSQSSKGRSHLPQNLLQGLTNLLVFNARDIKLQSLDKDMFKYTPRLQTLDISSNEIPTLSPELFSPIPNLKSLYISRTSLRSLDFLKEANLTQLEFLQARKNEYSVITEEIMGNKTLPALSYVDLQGNGFTCDCDNAWFLKWVKQNAQTQVFDAYNFVCNNRTDPDPKGMKLLDLDFQLCSVDFEFICYISTSCTILLFMAVSFIYNFLRWQLAYAYYLFLALLVDRKQKNKQDVNQYDAFISYNTHDEPWVIRELLPKLEEEQGWRLCLHHRDFEPGKPIIDNITDGIYGSRKTICVISRKYLESEWCSREIQVASFRLFDEKKDVLILVFLEEIPSYELSPYYSMRKVLKKKTYLNWPRAGEHPELFWEKLRQALKTREDFGDDRFHLTVVDRQYNAVV